MCSVKGAVMGAHDRLRSDVSRRMQLIPLRKRRLLIVWAVATATMYHVAAADVPGQCLVFQAGTIYDGRTGLTWQQAVDAGSYTHSQATAYCENLNLNGGGWRLPRLKELQTIVDYSRADPAIDPTAFPATPSGYFWTSSPAAGSATLKWIVSFINGSTNRISSTGTFRVRCVR